MEEIIGLNHLNQSTVLLKKVINLLQKGRDIYPYNNIILDLDSIIAKIKEEIEAEKSLKGIQ